MQYRNAVRTLAVCAAAVLVSCGGRKPTIYSVLRNYEQNNYPRVIEECKLLLEDDPEHVQAYHYLIKASKQLGTLDERVAEYKQLVEGRSDSAVAHFAYGYALVQAKEFDRAVPHLQRALELNREIEYVNYVLGWLHFNPLTEYYDVEKGLAAWERETEINPGSLGALQVYRDLASYYKDRGRFEQAREQMRAFRDHAFSEGDRVAARDLLERLKEEELEVVKLQQAADAEDASVEALMQYGTRLYQWQRPTEAIAYWERALEQDPENAELQNYVGMAHMEALDNDKAIAAFERATQLDPELGEAYYNLGMLYDTLGEYAKALPRYERYLELQPFSQQAEVLRERIEELRAEVTGEGGAPAAPTEESAPEGAAPEGAETEPS